MRKRRIYKAHPIAEGRLRGHVPTRLGCTTPRIRFLYVAPHLWIGLPPDPASRRRPCLRLAVTIPGTSEDLHLRDHGHARHTTEAPRSALSGAPRCL